MNKVEAGSHFHKSSSFNRNLTFSYFSENVKFKTWIKISHIYAFMEPQKFWEFRMYGTYVK